MDSEGLKKIEDVYHAILAVEPDGREAFLSEDCGSDEELRAEIESLLSFENPSESFLDKSPELLAA